jgi:hypothetical protein
MLPRLSLEWCNIYSTLLEIAHQGFLSFMAYEIKGLLPDIRELDLHAVICQKLIE